MLSCLGKKIRGPAKCNFKGDCMWSNTLVRNPEADMTGIIPRKGSPRRSDLAQRSLLWHRIITINTHLAVLLTLTISVSILLFVSMLVHRLQIQINVLVNKNEPPHTAIWGHKSRVPINRALPFEQLHRSKKNKAFYVSPETLSSVVRLRLQE